MKAADVIVIGAGIVGSSTAYYLAKAGFKVTLIDRQTPLAGGSATSASRAGHRLRFRWQSIPSISGAAWKPNWKTIWNTARTE